MSESHCPKCGAINRTTARFCSECGTLLVADSAPSSGEAPRQAPALESGKILNGRYRIEDELGRGGFGAVYRAWDNNLSRACAVKENLDTSPEAQRQFAREATVLANLSHPNLTRVTDHFVVPGQGQYLVMDFVEGEDLASLAKRGSHLAIEQAVDWALQVLEALEYLHGQQPPVLHRDIKPSNIRITPKGRAMLVDFGLVKLYDPHLKTTVGARAITPGYAPPEQYGQGRTDVRTDLYAMGATLYKILSGREPLESVQRMSGQALQPVTRLNPDVPEAVSRVVERAMALEPDKRYQSAQQFYEELKAGLAAGKQVSGKVAATVAVSPQPEALPAAYTPAADAIGSSALISDSEARGRERDRPASRPPSGPQGLARTQAVSEPFSTGRPASSPVARKRSGLSSGIVIGAIVVVVLLCLGGGAGLVALVVGGSQIAAESTATPVKATQVAQATATPQNSATPQVDTTATAQAFVTSTAQAEKTAAARAQETASARARITATAQARLAATTQARESYIQELMAQRKLVYGPKSGSLVHEEDDYIEAEEASVYYKNFVMEVRFFNPFSVARGKWDYGILFRDEEAKNSQYRLVIRADQSWEVTNHAGDPDGKVVADGSVSNLATADGAANLIRLVVKDNQGWLYVNNVFIAEFDLSSRTNPGSISIGTGMYNSGEIAGEETRYEGFTIWSLP
ncbi:MAG: protein kinase [Chloroflexota bacterium]